MKKIIFSIFIIANFLFAADVIKVGISNDYPPFEYLRDGKVKGFDVDFANLLFAKAGLKFEFIDVPYDEACSELNSGKINIAISAFRQGRFTHGCTVSEPYYDTKIIFIGTEGSGLKNIDDLNNTKIGYVNGEKLLEVIKEIPGAKPIKRSSLIGLILSLQNGKINGILTNSLTADGILNGDFSKFAEADSDKYDMLKSLGLNKKMMSFPIREDITVYFHVLFPKDAPKDLLEKINKAITELKEQKEIEKLIQKYSKS